MNHASIQYYVTKIPNRRWLQALINRYYDKHSRAYARARMRRDDERHPFRHSIHDVYLLHKEECDEQPHTDED